MKRLLFLCLGLLLCAAASAATRPLYRLDLRDGSRLLSRDKPVHRGSVVLFHSYPRGTLMGLPEEEVMAIESSATAPASNVAAGAPRSLLPGEILFLGPTGAGAQSPAASAVPAAPAIPGGVYDPRNPLYGGYGLGGSPAVAPGTEGDLARALAAEPPTAEPPIGSNGFPITTPASPPTVGPNGFPVMTGTGSQALTPNGFPAVGSSPTLSIGPDGQPVLAPAGSPGAAAPVIGPNGTPTLAPAGAPGSTQPAIGPNGTPTLAPPGTPGSAPPAVGPNGYPAAAPPKK